MATAPSTTLEVSRGTCNADKALGDREPCRNRGLSTYWPSTLPEIGPLQTEDTPESHLSIPHFGMTSPTSPTGAIAGSVLPIRRAEELIATLPGVLSVRIVPNDTGAIDEIHVLTTDAVAPKQTVRNIESALIAQLGWRVNHRKISIATTLDAPRAVDQPVAGSGAAPAPVGDLRAAAGSGAELGASAGLRVTPAADAPSKGGRRTLVFDDVEVRRSRSRGVTCRVTLRHDDTEYAGEAEGQESERSRIELSARATVAAIGEAVKAIRGVERQLSLEGSKLIDAFDREFVFVSVLARQGRDVVVLTGSSAVRDSAETSAALAVLDATNRWVQLDR